MARGPIVMEAAGDHFSGNVVIGGVLWNYPGSTAGHQANLYNDDGSLIWECVTDLTNTYLGALNLNVHSVGGFRCNRLDGGKLLVYLEEKF